MTFPKAKIYGPFDAVGLRGVTRGRHNEFGLYDGDGLPLPEAEIRGDLFTSSSVGNPDISKQPREIDVPVLFAGLAAKQFGHVILNSMGRLWALESLTPETRLMYLPMRRARLKFYPALKPMLKLMGVRSKPILHDGPTRYRAIHTATDLFGERYGGAASPEFRDWFQRKLPPRSSIEPGLKVYITRSRLGAAVGRYCNEDHLEELLAADGYQIVAPEQHGLNNQARLFQRAEKLIFAEGSALHLYGLVRQDGQSVAVIQRRPNLPKLIEGQLSGAPRVRMVAINAISGLYWPQRRADNVGLTTLDFNLLRDMLTAEGFVTPAARWSAPEAEAQNASLRAGIAESEPLLSEAEYQDWLRNLRRKRRKRRKAAA